MTDDEAPFPNGSLADKRSYLKSRKKTENKEDFCGYVCGPELDKIKSFVDNLRPVLKVNPELAKVMIGKARNEIYMLEEDIWREERKPKEHKHHWESVYSGEGKVGMRCCQCNEFFSLDPHNKEGS